MLSAAFSCAYQYTRPLIILKRLQNKSIAAGVGTFFVINQDGWALTAAHLVSDLRAAEQHRKEREEYQKACDAIDADPSLSPGKKKHHKRQLVSNSQWITKMSVWWGGNGVGSGPIFFDIEADIAMTKLTNLQNLNITDFPKFASAKRTLRPGTAMGRLGFPFFQIKASYDESRDDFAIPPIAAIPMFPNDGIHTRIAIDTRPNTNRQIKFIETSSPGLRGQSGGPIFDEEGVVWAVQSRTSSLPLGLAIEYEQDGRKKAAPEQFLHVGLGSHVDQIRALLSTQSVTVAEQD